jgi:hypothetical protein
MAIMIMEMQYVKHVLMLVKLVQVIVHVLLAVEKESMLLLVVVQMVNMKEAVENVKIVIMTVSLALEPLMLVPLVQEIELMLHIVLVKQDSLTIQLLTVHHALIDASIVHHVMFVSLVLIIELMLQPAVVPMDTMKSVELVETVVIPTVHQEVVPHVVTNVLLVKELPLPVALVMETDFIPQTVNVKTDTMTPDFPFVRDVLSDAKLVKQKLIIV